MMIENWVHNKTIFQGRVIRVRTGEVELEDGTRAYREVVDHGGGVGVVPVMGDHVILVRQFRIAVGKPMLEIPAGRLEPGEQPDHCARRELEEEVGCRTNRLVHVATCYCSPGFTSERDYLYLAFDLERTQQMLEQDERIALVEIPLDEIAARLDNMEFDDAKTIIALRELQAYLRR